jgi:hypothetical protein
LREFTIKENLFCRHCLKGYVLYIKDSRCLVCNIECPHCGKLHFRIFDDEGIPVDCEPTRADPNANVEHIKGRTKW